MVSLGLGLAWVYHMYLDIRECLLVRVSGPYIDRVLLLNDFFLTRLCSVASHWNFECDYRKCEYVFFISIGGNAKACTENQPVIEYQDYAMIDASPRFHFMVRPFDFVLNLARAGTSFGANLAGQVLSQFQVA